MNSPVEVRSAGAYVWDSEGTRYLDCGGYGVFFTGHCHPRIVAAARAQLETHPMATRVLLNGALATAAATLASVTPAGLDQIVFANSGAEAAEIALKLARLHGRTRVISMHGGYHGKTLGALSVTGRPHYRERFLPLLPDVTFVQFGDAEALRQELSTRGAETCVILEPVQAEAGVHLPPRGYLSDVAAECRAAGALLIADEVQSGMGRTGTWWACDAEDVIPDVMMIGKSLGGGVMPVSAVAASSAIMKPLSADPVLHSSTFAGNPLAMAAVRATIEVVREEGLVERARITGAYLLDGVRRAVAALRPDVVTDVRGAGLLIGIELATEALAGQLMLELLSRHVIVSHSLNAHRTVRLTPPAILDGTDCDLLLEALRSSLAALAPTQIKETR
jgi:putrescine aminotransferase